MIRTYRVASVVDGEVRYFKWDDRVAWSSWTPTASADVFPSRLKAERVRRRYRGSWVEETREINVRRGRRPAL